MENFIQKLLENAPVAAVLFVIVWYLLKRLEDSNKAHLDSQKDRIDTLEEHTKKCEEDRAEQAKQITRLHVEQKEVLSKVVDAISKLKD